MSRKFRFAACHISRASALIPCFCMALTACGGGSGGSSFVANIPPPPAIPTSTLPAGTMTFNYSRLTSSSLVDSKTSWLDSPATRVGSYDLIGRFTLTPSDGSPTSYRATAPRELSMDVESSSNGGLTYGLKAPSGILPQGLTSSTSFSPSFSWDINPGTAYRYTNPYGDTLQFLGQRLTIFDKQTDGTKTEVFTNDFTRGSSTAFTSLGSGKSLRTTLDYDVGYSFVAMGEWSWRVVDLSGATAGDAGDLLFVNGDRTPSTGIPATGTATYDARTLALWSVSGSTGIPFVLTADFGQRRMSTRIDQDYQFTSPVDGPILGIHVGGNAPFTNDGAFGIPLTGTANYASTNSPMTPPAQPVTGTMDGAFFGPHAEQVGGTFHLEGSDGTTLTQDAFVGQRH